MKTTFLLAGLAWGLLALPGAAYTVNMSSSYVPDGGQFEILEYVTISPYDLKVINSTTYQANDEEPGYFFAEAWTSFEAGLGNGISTSLVVPLDMVQSPVPEDSAMGLYDLTWTLSRKLWTTDAHSGRVRLRVDLATGDASRGLGAGVPGVGFEHSSDYSILPQLKAYLNLNYFYRMRQTGLSEEGALVTSWSGQRFQVNTAVEWLFNDNWAFILEQMGSWQEPGHAHRVLDPESGSGQVQLAPGVTWTISPSLAVQASVMVPVIRTGYTDSYRWSGVIGTVLDF